MKKKIFLALMCLASMSMFTACNPNKITDPDDPTIIDDDNPIAGTNGEYCWKVTFTSEDGLISTSEYWWETEEEVKNTVKALNDASGTNYYSYEKSTAKDKNECDELDKAAQEEDPTHGNYDWKANYEKAEPGIYMNGNELLAKGTDGCIFHILDVTEYQQPLEVAPEAIPAHWIGWDGKSSTYSFELHYYNDNDGNWMTHTYQDTVLYCMEAKWADASLQDMVDIYGGRMAFMGFHSFTKIADAGDFDQTFVEIAKRYQKVGPIVKPSDMIRHYTEHYMNRWLSDWYPADMEAAGYVFKYTGGGTIIEMGVQRIFQWGVKRDHWNWIPWSETDNVTGIKVVLNNVPEADAVAYINKVKAEGHYTRVIPDEFGLIGFSADSYNYYDDDVHGPAPEGLEGFVYPSYEISYIEGQLVIYFYVAKTSFV